VANFVIKENMSSCFVKLTLGVAALASIATPARAELSAEELAKLAQNPIGNLNLISVPFQNNTNLNVGPDKRTQNILNIQPVIPVSVNDEWNIITRTIVPVISQPLPNGDRTNGISAWLRKPPATPTAARRESFSAAPKSPC
jgi:hypothetical protein